MSTVKGADSLPSIVKSLKNKPSAVEVIDLHWGPLDWVSWNQNHINHNG